MSLRTLAFRSRILSQRSLLSSPTFVRLSSSSVGGAASSNNGKKEETSTPTTTESPDIKQDNISTTTSSVDKNKKTDSTTATTVNKEHGYEHGSLHWNKERASAIALIPLITTQFVYGPHSIVDGLLGVVLPWHLYLGFDSCITDYIQKRNYPRLHKLANWTLAGTTGLVMWGCYEFNTNDIGITELMQRFFTA